MINRISALQDKLVKEQLDGFISFNYENIRYLSGFSGSSSIILVTQRLAYFFTDFRYRIQSSEEVKGFELIEYKKQDRFLIEFLKGMSGLSRIGFEADHIPFSRYKDFTEGLSNIEFVPTKGIIEDMRLVKDQYEIAQIEKAIGIQKEAIENTMAYIKIGVTELEVASRLKYELAKAGSEADPFDIICTSGKRSALPHGKPSNAKKLERGDIITIDFGAKYKGYNSDITRTFVIAESNKKIEEVYNIVLDSQLNTIKNIKTGIYAADVDRYARDYIKEAGYGEYFGHATGHGIGLAVHELPRIAEDQDIVLKEGMVFTVEPGIYIPEFGGVRIEDVILVTLNGNMVISESIPKYYCILCQ